MNSTPSAAAEALGDAFISRFSDTTMQSSIFALLSIIAAVTLLSLLSHQLERRTTLSSFNESITIDYDDLTHMIDDAYTDGMRRHMEQNFILHSSSGDLGKPAVAGTSTPKMALRRRRRQKRPDGAEMALTALTALSADDAVGADSENVSVTQ